MLSAVCHKVRALASSLVFPISFASSSALLTLSWNPHCEEETQGAEDTWQGADQVW